MTLFRARLDARRLGSVNVDLALWMTAAAPISGLAEKGTLAIDTFPREVAKQIHHAVLQVLLSRNAPVGCRSAIWTFRIHAGSL